MKHLIGRISSAAITAAALLAPGVAIAQEAAPPQPGSLRGAPAPLIGIMIALVLLVAVVIVSLLPSKRTPNN